MRHSSSQGRGKKPKKPLDSEKLEALALHYLGRYATSRAKLERYLRRKLYERGWDGEGDGLRELDAILERCTKAGYVNDAAYATMRARDLAARGYGEGRLKQRLYADGIAEADGEEAKAHAAEQRVSAALAFAKRRRLGPWAGERAEGRQWERSLSAMLRAGHSMTLAKRILSLNPGENADPERFSEN